MRTLALIVSLSFAGQALAIRPQSTPTPQEQADVLKLTWQDYQDASFLKTPCKVQQAPSRADIEDYLSRIQDKESDSTVNGYSLRSEKKKVAKALKQLLKSQKSNGSNCDSALCVVEEVWGPELGPKILYMKLKHDFNGSEYAYDRSMRFTEDQIDDVLMVLGDFPSHLVRPGQRKNQRLLPAPDGAKYYYNSKINAAADSAVTLYDWWKNVDTHQGRHITLNHEIGHNIGFVGNKHYSFEWKNLHKSAKCFATPYAKTNEKEDFAETVAYYRYYGRQFKAFCPSKYAFMKKIYGGIEYLNSNTCNVPSNIQAPVEQKTLGDFLGEAEEAIGKLFKKPKPKPDGVN